jgi:lipase chaperone LimK
MSLSRYRLPLFIIASLLLGLLWVIFIFSKAPSSRDAPPLGQISLKEENVQVSHPLQAQGDLRANPIELAAKALEHESKNNKDLRLNLSLRWHFDDIILTLQSQASDKNSTSELLQQLADNLSLSTQGRASLKALFDNYRAYAMALADIKPSNLSMDYVDITAATALLTQAHELQWQYFNEAEIAAFFKQDNNYDKQALERVEIRQDSSLSDSQKQQLLAHHISQLPPQALNAIAPSLEATVIASMLDTEVKPSAQINAEHSAQVALLSPEVQQRVTSTRQQNQAWRTKVENYAAFSLQLSAEKHQHKELQQLTEHYLAQHFSANEIKRLRVFIAHPELLTN